jgi:hypothetical protein
MPPVREDHKQARDYELSALRGRINNALRAATDYLVQLRDARHAEIER